MDKYFLSKDELEATCVFNSTWTFSTKADLSYRIALLEKRIVKDLLLKQPELELLHSTFLASIKDAPYVGSEFSRIFADKIELSNFTTQVFGKNGNVDKYDEYKRTNLFKHIFERYPPFLQLAHDYIKNNNNTDDVTLYDFYFQTLKNKNTDKSSLNLDEVRSNIDSFSVNENITNNKKKLNAYLSLFPKDEILYKHIMQEMGDMISNNGAFKTIWEEKIQKFPDEIQKEYKNKSIAIVPWFEQEKYYYKFELNHQYVIKKTSCSKTDALDFCRVLHNTVNLFITSKLKLGNTLRESSNESAIGYTFDSAEKREEAKHLFNMLGQDIDSLIKPLISLTDYHERQEKIEKYLEKLHMAMQLNKQLSENQSSSTNKVKNKI